MTSESGAPRKRGLDRMTLEFPVEGEEVSFAVSALSLVEYQYNVLAYTDRSVRNPRTAMHNIERLLGQRTNLGIVATNELLRERLAPSRRLQIVSTRSQSPLSITFKGVGSALEVIRSIFDPYWWKERKEHAGHEKVMNRYEEEDRAVESLQKRLEVLPALLELRSRLETSGFSDEEINAVMQLTIGELAIGTALTRQLMPVSATSPDRGRGLLTSQAPLSQGELGSGSTDSPAH